MNLVSKLEETAAVKPDKTACIFGGESITYEELRESIFRFANGLQDLGMEKGDDLALLLGYTP
ncbi:AMP-binding protein, partial [Bacillus atrophaeus]|uniref:AMP-binding protein n=1 Tax=Bacillus atrophaeus TaxID=1452 RepID=UPI002280F9A6